MVIRREKIILHGYYSFLNLLSDLYRYIFVHISYTDLTARFALLKNIQNTFVFPLITFFHATVLNESFPINILISDTNLFRNTGRVIFGT